MVNTLVSSLAKAGVKKIQDMAVTWVKAQFNGNPIIEDTNEYLSQVGQAMGIGFAAMLAIIPLAFLIYGGLIISVLNGWL